MGENDENKITVYVSTFLRFYVSTFLRFYVSTFLRIYRVLLSFGFVLLFSGYNIAPVIGAEVADYRALPPFLTTEVTPNVMFMLDNSGSMKKSLYDGGSYKCKSYGADFNPAKEYYGPFDETITYKYDGTIPIDYNGYNGNGTTDSSYTIDVNLDGKTDSQDINGLPGAFVEDAACSPGAGINCWDGNFLNWMVTRRIDAARKVMIGGKVESRKGYDYRGNDGDLEWKIVVNNERSDNSICKTDASAQTYSPYPNGTKFKITSPAEKGKTLSSYDPYAKLQAEGSLPQSTQSIEDKDGAVIGESGIIKRFNKDAGRNKWETVSLQSNYTDPIVVATPFSYNGPDPSIARVYDIRGNSFKIRIEEWEYLDGRHTYEDISYLVIERGEHTLTGGEKIIAGTQGVDATRWETVDISSAGFATTPIIISTVTTNFNGDTVTTRQQNIDNDSFEIILQEEEDCRNRGDRKRHPEETVSFIVLEQGSYSGGLTFFEVGTKSVRSKFSTISFAEEVREPNFLASIQTFKSGDPASLRYKSLTSNSVNIFIEEEKSADTEMNHVNEDVGYVIISKINRFNIALLVDEEPTGLLHDVADKVRLGLSFYKYKKDSDIYNDEVSHGGTIQLSIPHNPFIKNPDLDTGYRTAETPINKGIEYIVDAIEHYPLVWGTTPLAENYFEIIRYFQQVAPYYTDKINKGQTIKSYKVDNTWDPYYFEDPDGDVDTKDAEKISCAQSYVLLFTDGASYKDGYVPKKYKGNKLIDFDDDGNDGDCFSRKANSRKCEDNLDDLSKWAHCAEGGKGKTCSAKGDRDLRPDLAGNQNLTTYTVAFGQATPPVNLQDTADYGGGIAYAAEDGKELKNQLTDAFTNILSRSSGTAASVISNSRSGEGGVYQSVFFPGKTDNNDNTVNWVGEIYALMVDAYGYMHEDTNNNKRLDPRKDKIVSFGENGSASLYMDADGNRERDTTKDKNGKEMEKEEKKSLDDLEYLWDSSSWLNEISDSNVESQRSSYLSEVAERYIFTWIDGDEDGLVDVTSYSSEVMPFECLKDPSAADLTDPGKIFPYLHLYPSFANTPSVISSLSATDLENFLIKQTRRQINYIRGSDCADATDSTTCNTKDQEIGGNDIVGSAMRSRQFDYDSDKDVETWRLGDIIHSTPTLVGRPAEVFHLIYRDTSYASFAAKYNKRRNVIYAGANDGMVHAFNAGFFHSPTNSFCREINPAYDPNDPNDPNNNQPCVENTSAGLTSMPELGAELWAYVPFNLLPHLHWLTQTTYNQDQHVYYVDQKPRIFDAKIFKEEMSCRSGADTDGDGNDDLDKLYDPNCTHPNGWGTVMVIGMRFGGASIIADMDKTDGGYNPSEDKTMKSAFMVFDISDPEKEPQLLAELTMPDMGFSTSNPTVVAMNDGDHDREFEEYDDGDPSYGENRWFLGFGSGPADVNGDPGGFDANDKYDRTILESAKSLQKAKFYMVDLVKLASKNELYTLNDSGALKDGLHSYVTLDDNSFVSAPVTVDYDLDYNADAVYFGTISGDSSGWGGKLRRIVVDDDKDPEKWDSDSIFLDAGQPITAAPSVGKDDDGRYWIYFGTGRYYVTDDKLDRSLQSYYGLKEPLDTSGEKSWGTLAGRGLTSSAGGELLNVTKYQVFTDSTHQTWDKLVAGQQDKGGWHLDFCESDDCSDTDNLKGERNIGQAALMGGLLTFTTFTPSSDICETGGTSDLWALYYKTGTAHHTKILGVTKHNQNKDKALRKVSLGKGLATSPSIHTGSQEGSTVFVQSSDGEINRIEVINPLKTKSGTQFWQMQ